MKRPKKLSKSDKIDKDEEARVREWLATKRSSSHFTPGTFVLYNGKRYEVVYRFSNALMLGDENRDVITVFPYALN